MWNQGTPQEGQYNSNYLNNLVSGSLEDATRKSLKFFLLMKQGCTKGHHNSSPWARCAQVS